MRTIGAIGEPPQKTAPSAPPLLTRPALPYLTKNTGSTHATLVVPPGASGAGNVVLSACASFQRLLLTTMSTSTYATRGVRACSLAKF